MSTCSEKSTEELLVHTTYYCLRVNVHSSPGGVCMLGGGGGGGGGTWLCFFPKSNCSTISVLAEILVCVCVGGGGCFPKNATG